MKTEYEQFLKTLTEMEESQYEYETEHIDAGGNYAHLVREGDTMAIAQRLKDFVNEHCGIELSPSRLDNLLEFVLDRCEYGDEDSIHSGHIFSGDGEPDWFHVDSFPVEEIETQYCFDDSYMGERFGVENPKLLRAFFRKAEKEREICARISENDALLYQATDSVWIFRVSRDEILEHLRKETKH